MMGLDEFWAGLLSSDSRRILNVWSGLIEGEHEDILQHLVQMRDGPGWHPAQREAAAAAIDIIHEPGRSFPSSPE